MNARFSLALTVLTGALALSAAACDTAPGLTKKAKSPTAPTQEPTGNVTTTAGDPRASGAPPIMTTNLSVSDEIASTCGIPPRTEGKVAPSFEFDSAALGDDDRQMLALVAKCLTEGALRGRSVSLVGRADPRGENEYNMTLGGSRANSVQRYMVDLGVGRDKLHPTSRGELDATGTDEAGWAKDRRVDIELQH
jgi:peptidoglycan-associated lipoprotein